MSRPLSWQEQGEVVDTHWILGLILFRVHSAPLRQSPAVLPWCHWTEPGTGLGYGRRDSAPHCQAGGHHCCGTYIALQHAHASRCYVPPSAHPAPKGAWKPSWGWISDGMDLTGWKNHPKRPRACFCFTLPWRFTVNAPLAAEFC